MPVRSVVDVDLVAAQNLKDPISASGEEDYYYDRRERKLDPGVTIVRKRERWYQWWLPKYDAPPPRPTLAEAPVIPLVTASWLSVLTFSWITPILSLGFARTLQATDLYALDESRSAHYLSSKLEESWSRRMAEAKEWNNRLDRGEIVPSRLRLLQWWFSRTFRLRLPWKGEDGQEVVGREEQERKWREGKRKKPSLIWALNDVLRNRFWIAGAYKVFGDVSQLMSPLVVRAIITFSQKHFNASHPVPGTVPIKAPPIVEGVFMAIALFLLSNFQNIGQQHFFWRSMSTGVLARGALISSIYKRGVYLTPTARKQYDNSRIVHFISGDVSRIDAASQWFHAAWTAPIQITICLIILLIQLGPTALIGFSLFLLLVPLQEVLMKLQLKFRKTASDWSDKGMSILGECLSGMKVVKWFCYENRFLERISDFRKQELRNIWKIEVNNSINLALGLSVPSLAAVLTFTTYLLTAHDFNVAIIFSSMALFNLLGQPLLYFPRAISSIADAQSALKRLTPFFLSPINKRSAIQVDETLEVAVDIDSASFVWEEVAKEKPANAPSPKSKSKKKETEMQATAEPPFELHNISMKIPRGTLVAIVGPVGSGKSSLLQGLIGEMRQTAGRVRFGGTVAYCSQVAWIQNTSLRENILFGRPYEASTYQKALQKSSLIPDLQVLPDADLTEIGEKGINLGGGQKQRVNIARALYYDADIIILDDPLSAVDAHVGKALFQDAIRGTLREAGKTVILVTHALHFVSEVDYIFTLRNGHIAEHGTYSQLMESKRDFFSLLTQHGGSTTNSSSSEDNGNTATQKNDPAPTPEGPSKKPTPADGRKGELTVNEKRTTGSVTWKIYGSYFQAGRPYLMVPMILLSAVLMQASQVLNSYILVWWQDNAFDLPETTYALIYAILGLGQALFTFSLGASIAGMARATSQELHSRSLWRIFHAPASFFDTTPIGRLIGVFGKDFDSVDNQLTTALRMFLGAAAICLGAIVIVTILEHYFLIVIFVMGIGYSYSASFYGASATEIKRLDAMLRSWLYSHFSESLTGLPILKAYDAMDMFISDTEYYVDLENRALFLTAANQRWLALRLGFLGSILTLFVAIFAVCGISGISPAQIGLILNYTINLSQMLSAVLRQSTEVENCMNAAERSKPSFTSEEAPY